MSPRLATVANALGFQAVWFACVAGAGAGAGWLGPLAAGLFALATLSWSRRAGDDLRLLGWLVPLGWLLDSAFSASGALVYAATWSPLPASLAPPWIAALWLGFALTLNHSLAFLRQKPGWAAALAGVGAPLSYTAAAGFGAVEFAASRAAALAAIALAWGLFLPLVGVLHARLQPPLPAERMA